MSEETQVRRILKAAGVADDMVETMVATGLDADTAKRLAPALAMSHPAVATSQYRTAQETYGFTSTEPQGPIGGALGAAATAIGRATGQRGYRTNESGALFYDNGVIADPSTGDVFFPPNDESVPGSFAWLDRVQDAWDEDKIKEWRDRLFDYGYDISKSGGFDQTFIGALQDFHRARYLNRGRPIPYTARTEDDEQLFTKPEVHNFWREVFRQKFGDDPTPGEIRDFTKASIQFGRQFLKKGFSPEAAATAAEEKSIEMFENDPKVRFLTRSAEENTRVADGLRAVVASIDTLARSS